MGTAAKVFATINLVLGIFATIFVAIFGIYLASFDRMGALVFLWLLFLVPSIIVSYVMIKSVNEMSKNVAIGVAGLLFVSLLGGIFYLSWDPYGTRETKEPVHSINKTSYTPSYLSTGNSSTATNLNGGKYADSDPISPAEAMLELKKLYDLKILNTEQYGEKINKYK